VPFLRLTRDQRGYENTFLLHTPHPGNRPRVLYWYRSAPGVRVGRPPLDEEAIRTIEERHPEIEFDWPHILEAGTVLPPEVERRPERRRRPRVREESPVAAQPAQVRAAPVPDEEPDTATDTVIDDVPVSVVSGGEIAASKPRRPENTMLDELVGREIAARLRVRFREIEDAIAAAADASSRPAWHARARALDPDGWTTPAEILHGVQHADQLFDELRRAISAPSSEVSSSG
jgi:hypothetical protein